MRVVARREELLQALAAAEGRLDATAETTAAAGGLTLLLNGQACPGAPYADFAQITLSVDVLEEGQAHLDVELLSARLRALVSESVVVAAVSGGRDFTVAPAGGPGSSGARVPAAPATVDDSLPYATWGSRVGAYLIDGVLLAAVFLLVSVLLRHEGNGLLLGIAIAIQAVYFTVSHGSAHGQTLGKRTLGIAVRRAADASRCSYPQAFARYGVVLAFSFGFLVLTIVDDLWPLRDARRQALHDKVVGTIVVRV